MQTFLPYNDFSKSSQVLDYRRLGKQRVECLQILKALKGGGGWSNHPATKMWRGFEDALVWYGVTICDEWIRRGYKDTCRDKLLTYSSTPGSLAVEILIPPWFGENEVHSSHRANLLRKDPGFYSQYNWRESPMEGYVWPTI